MRLFRISTQALQLLILLGGGILVLIASQPTRALYILLPTLLALWICSYCIMRVWARDGDIPILDIGVFCVIITTLYTVIPLLNFYFGGLDFGPLSDGRLQRHRPSPVELGLFFRNHLAYLASLAFAYLFFRTSNKALPRFQVSPPNPSTLNVLVLIFLILTLYFSVLLYVFGIGFKSGYGDETHVSEGPLWLQQINGKVADIQFIFQTAVLAYLVLRKDDIRVRYFLALLIGWNVAVAFIQPGSRNELLSLLLLSFLFWHRFHGTRLRFTLIFLPLVFTTFMFLGLFRSFLNVDDLALALEKFETIASATNEFQAMLGTAFDTYKIVESGVDIPPILAFNDFTPMLPPQQLLPFEKIVGADWYLIQIGHDGTGIGFVWSVISQSLIGFGLVELVIRGVVLGWFLAHIHRWYQHRYTKFLPTVIYVLLCLASLSTFRDTTGAILWVIWWGSIPFAFMFYLLGLRSEFSRVSVDRVRHGHRSPMPAGVRL